MMQEVINYAQQVVREQPHAIPVAMCGLVLVGVVRYVAERIKDVFYNKVR